MENEIKDEKIAAQNEAVETGDAAAPKAVGVCSMNFSFKRLAMILLAMFIGFAIGIGVTWIAFDRLNQPNVDEIPEEQVEEEKAPKAKAKGKGEKSGKPRAKGMRLDPKRVTAMNMSQLSKAIAKYKEATGAYPAVAKNLYPVVDGWGNLLVFNVPGKDGRAFDLISCGADGKLGTEDDINSWELPRRRGRGGKRPAKK